MASKQRELIMQAAVRGINEMLDRQKSLFGPHAKAQLFESQKGVKPPVIRIIDDKANVYELDMVEY